MKRIRKLFSIWMVLTLMVQAIAMAGVGPVAVAQGPSGGEKHHVPPRPDLFQIIQEGEDAGARLNAASDDPADAEAAFRDYLATKLQGYGGGIAQDAGSGVGLSQVANSRLLVVLVDLDDATHNNIPYVPPADLPYDYWYSDFDYTHYDRMLFDTTNIWSLRNWVREASDNLFDLQGQIYDGAGTDIDGWVALTNDLTDYGEDDPGGGVDNVGANDLFQFVRDAADEINSAWAPPGGWGNYHGGDGVIDYFVVVHAGRGQESGGGIYGDDSLWSTCGTLPSAHTFDPGDGLAIQNFVVVAEDSPVGVWAHEMGHLFGLPDTWNPPSAGDPKVDDVAWPLETADAVGEASPSFYDPMAQGCWLGMPMGTRPASMSAWARIALGWLTPFVWNAATDLPTSVYLAQIESYVSANRVVQIQLPQNLLVTPHTLDYMYAPTCYATDSPFSTPVSATNALELHLTVPDEVEVELAWRQWYDLIDGFDRAWVMVEEAGPTVTIDPITLTIPFGESIEVPGNVDGWVPESIDISAFRGRSVIVYFMLERTQPGGGIGWFLDTFELLVDDAVVDQDYLDNGGWDGEVNWDPIGDCWERVTGFGDEHGYLIEWRNDNDLAGFDKGLQEAYNWRDVGGGYVEYFRMNPGMLVWYYNGLYPSGDNNVLAHPGKGFLLAVDAHSTPEVQPATAEVWRTRVQMQDATFRAAGHPTYENELHYMDGTTEYSQTIGPKPADTDFWDKWSSYPYWDEDAPYNSVQTPQYGVRVWVRRENPDQTGADIDIGLDAGDLSDSYKLVDKAEVELSTYAQTVLQYTIVLINTGIADAHQIVVSDTAPMYGEIVVGSLDVQGAPAELEREESAEAIYWKGTVPLASPVTITFDVRLDWMIPNGTIVENAARIYEGAPYPQFLEKIVYAETGIISEPCLTSSSKVADPSEVLAGGLITYTITLENTGTDNVDNAIVTDCMPICSCPEDPDCTGYVPGSLQFSAGDGEYVEELEGCESGGIVWQGPVHVGVSTVITFVVQIEAGEEDCTLVRNCVIIDDRATGIFDKCADTTIIDAPNFWTSDKSVETQTGGGIAAPGEVLTYTLLVENVGNQPSYAFVGDPIPEYTEYVSNSLSCTMGTCEYSPTLDAILWLSDDPIAPLTSETISFSVMVTSPLTNGTIITNTGYFETETQMFTRGVTTTVRSEPWLYNSSKTVDTGPAAYGGVITYTLVLYNEGTEDASVDMTDDEPDGTEVIASSLTVEPGTKNAPAYGSGQVTWSDTVARGEVVTITYAVSITLDGSGVITNCFTIDDNHEDHDPFEICSGEVWVAGLTVGTDDTVYACGDLVSVPIYISNVVDLQGFQIALDFVTGTLQVEEILNGTWFSPAAWTVKEFNNTEGRILVAATLISQPEGKTGSGLLFTINFRVVGEIPNPSPITIVPEGTHLVNSSLLESNAIPYNHEDGEVYLTGRAMTGYVVLQGRDEHDGAIVHYNGSYVVTDADGFYSFCPPVGFGDLVNVKIELDGYLWGDEDWPVDEVSGTIELPEVTLLGGNPVGPSVSVTPAMTCSITGTMTVAGPPDDVINILDLTFIGARFNEAEIPGDPWEPIDWFGLYECYTDYDFIGRADINNDGKVDIFDLVLVGYNFNETAPVTWF